jgi:hypothetical protein
MKASSTQSERQKHMSSRVLPADLRLLVSLAGNRA